MLLAIDNTDPIKGPLEGEYLRASGADKFKSHEDVEFSFFFAVSVEGGQMPAFVSDFAMFCSQEELHYHVARRRRWWCHK